MSKSYQPCSLPSQSTRAFTNGRQAAGRRYGVIATFRTQSRVVG